MTTYRQITEAMRDLDREIAPGSESSQMQDYMAVLLCSTDRDSEAPADFTAFWLAVAARDLDTAAEHGDINPSWVTHTDHCPHCNECVTCTAGDEFGIDSHDVSACA